MGRKKNKWNIAERGPVGREARVGNGEAYMSKVQCKRYIYQNVIMRPITLHSNIYIHIYVYLK